MKMHRTSARLFFGGGIIAISAAGVSAQVDNLRLSEVLPSTNQFEVMNTGPAFTVPAHVWTCFNLDYAASIPTGTKFAAGERKVYPLPFINNLNSDLWLYKSSFFDFGGNIIHGLKYGPGPDIGRTGLASSVGLWPGAKFFVPSPPVGMSVVYEGFGFHPHDWYINANPSLGSPHVTTPGTIADRIAYPGGMQTFEEMALGDAVVALQGWVVVNTGAPERFSMRAVSDVMSQTVGVAPHAGSSRWLRIRDRDPGDVQNRFYSPTVTAPEPTDYTWSFFINLETMPPGGDAAKPRITIQHIDTEVGFANAWGVEFAASGASLIITGVGGPAASTPLYEIAGDTGIGQWVHLAISVDFGASTVSASVNGGEPVTLPINPDATMNRAVHRWCYRGEGAGNEMVMLLDDVAVEFHPAAPCPGDLTGSGTVGVPDLLALLGCWGAVVPGCEPSDLTNSDNVGVPDLLQLLSAWGPCP